MNISLKDVKAALQSFNAGVDEIGEAIVALDRALCVLDEVEVKGRDKLDTLLGCMMAIEAIIGKEDSNG